jgi:hypothetical protein
MSTARAAGEMTDAELVAEIERLERLWNGQRRAGGGSQAPTLFEVARRLDAIDQEWRCGLAIDGTDERGDRPCTGGEVIDV